jgi:hypothetical protein
MPCGYPDTKELMGLLLQKFEILEKERRKITRETKLFS